MEIKLTSENFQKEVMNVKDKLVMVDFWATWCGPCRALGPVVEELAEAYDGRVVVGKVNVDEEPELAAQFRVSSIPSVFFIKNGEVVKHAVGFQEYDNWVAIIESLL
ncbi:thioredoxin [Amygdalobacter nucleatus]|uniref:Thioredoxin n=1 Tax=Amygdalobacter nucleatus TaxID=3029274 RepID=A0A133Y6Z5_9FIRM|nr:thioredoxin [Amygdalobacter nucleatus]KXB38923.1 thioredoxin [Amygdalobacter nucleatus]MDF0485278.1 thioredoxin [Amygdalobacter nucleatus]